MSKANVYHYEGKPKYEFHENSLKQIEGELLTIIDAAISDERQCDAVKSIFRNTWHDWIKYANVNNSNIETPPAPTFVNITNK